jgi:hypothetical protein
MALSVGEMAELIRRPDMDRAAVIERLRTWTDAGLLDPMDRSVGTGHSREYADSAVYYAGILNVLADFGVPLKATHKAGYSGYLAMVSFCANAARTIWEAEGRSGPMLYLEVADFGKTDVQGRRFFVFLHPPDKKDHPGELIHPRAESAHVINLSLLFDRIDARKAAQAAERKQA